MRRVAYDGARSRSGFVQHVYVGASIDGNVDRMRADLPFEGRPLLVIMALEVAEPVRMGEGRVQAVGQPGQAGRAGDIVAVRDRAEGAALDGRAGMEIGRGRVMDDIDRATRRTAAEERRAAAMVGECCGARTFATRGLADRWFRRLSYQRLAKGEVLPGSAQEVPW